MASLILSVVALLGVAFLGVKPAGQTTQMSQPGSVAACSVHDPCSTLLAITEQACHSLRFYFAYPSYFAGTNSPMRNSSTSCAVKATGSCGMKFVHAHCHAS